MPVLLGTAATAAAFFFLARPFIGQIFAGLLALAILITPVSFAAQLTRKDRDWFYLAMEVIALRVRYARHRFWSWKNDLR
jgi:hypothetical protein